MTPCCDTHIHGPARPNGMAACCDTNDCGPCCPNCPTCPSTNTVPHRRIRVRIDLEADTVADARTAIEQIAFDLETKERAGQETAWMTSGSYVSGWHVDMTCNPEQTGDQYREELRTWRDARRKERRG